MSAETVEKPKENSNNRLETMVGVCVVLLATFIGICNVKDGNIVQKMQQAQASTNNNWAWYQARNIRQAVNESTGENLSVPFPGESAEVKAAREAMAAKYLSLAKKQEEKMDSQKKIAEDSQKEYDDLNNLDDKFDLCEALLAIGLALMGVTALAKRWWLFFLSLFPSGLGVWMGIAGFMQVEPNIPFLKDLIRLLS
jgi:hypothetical protein